MLDELFIQHPLPWRAEGIFDNDEAWAVVYDRNGHEVWRIEDTDRREMQPSDILLAHAIAALPELLTSTKVLADELETWLTVFGDSRTVAHNRAANATTAGHAALDKAGAIKE